MAAEVRGMSYRAPIIAMFLHQASPDDESAIDEMQALLTEYMKIHGIETDFLKFMRNLYMTADYAFLDFFLVHMKHMLANRGLAVASITWGPAEAEFVIKCTVTIKTPPDLYTPIDMSPIFGPSMFGYLELSRETIDTILINMTVSRNDHRITARARAGVTPRVTSFDPDFISDHGFTETVVSAAAGPSHVSASVYIGGASWGSAPLTRPQNAAS